MQAQETHGVARRSLDLEDYIDLIGRHKGWIFGPLFAMVVLTVVGSYLWPDTYESERQASASLSKMQSGYEVGVAPLLPQTPSEPKRPLIVGMGALLGLFLGLVTVGVREVRDTSIKSLKDARAYSKAKILASIPLIENEIVVRRRRRIVWLGWTVGILVGVALMATSVVYYYATKA